MTRKFILPATVAVIVALAGSAYASGPVPGAQLGTTAEDISAALARDGYEMTKFERDEGRIEVYATKDGRRWELKIDPKTGNVLSIEAED